MDDACEAVALPWLLKKAVLVLNKLEVSRMSPGPPAAACGGGGAQPPDLSLSVHQQRQAHSFHARILPAAWSPGLPDGVGLLRQLEDAPEHFATTLKAGGILDVVERYPCELLSPL